MTACARRELFEETGISADPSDVAFVVESVPPGSSRRLLDVVFAVNVPVLGRECSREPGLEPRYLPSDQLADLKLHPSLAGHRVQDHTAGAASSRQPSHWLWYGLFTKWRRWARTSAMRSAKRWARAKRRAGLPGPGRLPGGNAERRHLAGSRMAIS